MVVTRRAPAPPIPTSRTNSSQPVPRAKGNAPQSGPYVPDVPSPLANGKGGSNHDGSAGHPSDGKTSRAVGNSRRSKYDKKPGKSLSFLDFLIRLLAIGFIAYSLSLCPDDPRYQSSICRGVSEYRRHVYDPYIVPQVHRVLSHPSVSPYVEKAKPIAGHVYTTAKPIALRTQLEWNKRVVPQWRKRVIPLYNKHALPYVRRAEAQIAPYVRRAELEYQIRVAPYVRYTAMTLQKWQRKARPYVVTAAHKTYDGYLCIRPYARPAWEKLKDLLARAAVIMGQYRRQFVDPHVKQIWERAKELSRGKPTSVGDAPSAVTSQAPGAARSASSVASSVASAAVSLGGQASSVSDIASATVARVPETRSAADILDAVVSPSSTPLSAQASHSLSSLTSDLSESARSTASIVSSVASSAASPLSETASSQGEKVVSSAASTASVLSASLSSVSPVSSASSVASSITSQAAVSASNLGDVAASVLSQASGSAQKIGSSLFSGASSVAEEATSVIPHVGAPSAETSANDVVVVTKSGGSVLPSPTLPPEAEPEATVLIKHVAGDDPDMDVSLEEFYAELGLEEDFGSTTTATGEATPAAPMHQHVETEEEKAERLRVRRQKNAQKREDIEQRHAKWEVELSDSIKANQKALRKALVAIRKAAAAELKESKEISGEIDSLVDEAEKYLRGAEKYFQNLMREDRSLDEKRLLWEKVVSKVDEKFVQRLTQAETLVNGWYLQVLNKELDEVRKVTDEVKDIATQGQTDLGFDYAYLDDVTYKDWQRYHDLLRTSDNFTALAQSIQNGTHPSPPINPVVAGMSELQSEVEDVVLGFQTRLRRIRRNGERAFNGQDIEPDMSESADDQTVSILPIENEDDQTPADVHVPPVVIGRSKEEVADALNRVAEQEGTATSAPGDKVKMDSEDALVHDLEEEAEAAAASELSSSPHEEL
ncbi:hypothetical protein CERSUDRAFT_112841 [Gelatoporia subvermispora B]|uniref:Uncharacterized protein n=1 Tax=Ceriporiopsis subvermispora (strain B) TaxID=914234 RepID=M2R3Q6_CERS8|nr:hypothetical protein CERSUDRAFT_112841 [Gelatoporia subvermispora B]